jgi:hypothetical protein
VLAADAKLIISGEGAVPLHTGTAAVSFGDAARTVAITFLNETAMTGAVMDHKGNRTITVTTHNDGAALSATSGGGFSGGATCGVSHGSGPTGLHVDTHHKRKARQVAESDQWDCVSGVTRAISSMSNLHPASALFHNPIRLSLQN